MAISFDENGQLCITDSDVKACPTDPMDALQCESCQ